MANYYRASECASAFASYVHELHKEISDMIIQSNVNYKLHTDVRKRLKTFNFGDFVMVQIRPEQFPPEPLKSYMLVVLIHFKS